MDRYIKGSMEAISEYVRFHPDLSYSIEQCDDGDFILYIRSKKVVSNRFWDFLFKIWGF